MKLPRTGRDRPLLATEFHALPDFFLVLVVLRPSSYGRATSVPHLELDFSYSLRTFEIQAVRTSLYSLIQSRPVVSLIRKEEMS